MITYTYKCDNCTTIFEVMSKMSETTPTSPCPECEKEAKKVMVPSAFICPRADGRSKKVYKTSSNPSKLWY